MDGRGFRMDRRPFFMGRKWGGNGKGFGGRWCFLRLTMLSDVSWEGDQPVKKAVLSGRFSLGLMSALILFPALALPALAAPKHGGAEKKGVQAASASGPGKGAAEAKGTGAEREAESRKQMAADAQQLVQLAKELKAAVDKSNENELSLDVVRKAAAIEKLAKQVQAKMRGEMDPAQR